jgi:sugar/nucleoside kinase (ribokinase family)
MDLLVVGDANPDLVVRGGDVVPAFGQREQIVDEAALVLGGSGSIMACGAARLGLSVGMVACVGDDALGRFTVEALADAGVDTSAVQVLAEATGVTVALARGDDRAILTARGAIAALDPAGVSFGAARHVHVTSPFLQPRLLAGLPDVIARAHAAGRTVSLDPGWDPSERWELELGVDVLLPNAQEADALGGGPALSASGTIVVVKLGAEGAVAYAGAEVVSAGAPRVDVVDATGAGDSFDAGFLCAWLDGLGLERALALGCACGALSTRALGGTAGQPDREEALAHMVAP